MGIDKAKYNVRGSQGSATIDSTYCAIDLVESIVICKWSEHCLPKESFGKETMQRKNISYLFLPFFALTPFRCIYACLTQLVEYRFCKPNVVGSIPTVGFHLF